jgi:hypothetical protein
MVAKWSEGGGEGRWEKVVIVVLIGFGAIIEE